MEEVSNCALEATVGLLGLTLMSAGNFLHPGAATDAVNAAIIKNFVRMVVILKRESQVYAIGTGSGQLTRLQPIQRGGAGGQLRRIDAFGRFLPDHPGVAGDERQVEAFKRESGNGRLCDRIS